MKTSNLFKGELMTILISVWISALGIRVIFAKVTVVTQIFEWYGNSGLAHLGRVTDYCKNKKRKKNKHFDKKFAPTGGNSPIGLGIGPQMKDQLSK